MTNQEKSFELYTKAAMVELELFETLSPEQLALYRKMDDLQEQAERTEAGY